MTSLVHKAMNSNKTPGEETQTNEYARDIQFYQRTVEDLKEEVFALKEENSSLEEENRSLKLQFEPTATPGQSNKTNETGSVDPDLESMECQSSVTGNNFTFYVITYLLNKSENATRELFVMYVQKETRLIIFKDAHLS